MLNQIYPSIIIILPGARASVHLQTNINAILYSNKHSLKIIHQTHSVITALKQQQPQKHFIASFAVRTLCFKHHIFKCHGKAGETRQMTPRGGGSMLVLKLIFKIVSTLCSLEPAESNYTSESAVLTK